MKKQITYIEKELLPIIQKYIEKEGIAWENGYREWTLGPYESQNSKTDKGLLEILTELHDKNSKDNCVDIVWHVIDYHALPRHNDLHTVYSVEMSWKKFPGEDLTWLIEFSYYDFVGDGISEVENVRDLYIYKPEI